MVERDMFIDELFELVEDLDPKARERVLSSHRDQTLARSVRALFVRGVTAHEAIVTGADRSSPRAMQLEACRVGALITDKYRVLEVVGEGASGVVLKVELTSNLRTVYAVKLLVGDGANLQRAAEEAQAIAEIEDDRFPRVHEVSTHAGAPFLAMEFVKGANLADKPPDSLNEILRLMIQACHAIAAAHQQGVLHRDLKPHNMIRQYDGGGLKIVDLGLSASSTSTDPTKTAWIEVGKVRLRGTPAYLAPELLLGASASERSDVYGLGATLFELLAGHPPYQPRPGARSGKDDVLAQIGAARRPPRLRAREGARRNLRRILAKAMATAPENRYASAAELAQALTAYVDQASLPADGPLVRAETLAARHRESIRTAGWLFALAMIAGLVVQQLVDRLTVEGQARGTLQLRLETRDRENRALEIQLSEEKRAHQVANDTISVRDAALAARMLENDGLAKSLADEQRQRGAAEKTLALRETALATLTDEKKEVDNELANRVSENDGLAKSLAEEQRQRGAAEKTIALRETALAALQKEKDTTEARLASEAAMYAKERDDARRERDQARGEAHVAVATPAVRKADAPAPELQAIPAVTVTSSTAP